MPVLKQALVQFYAGKRLKDKANAAYVDKLFHNNPYAVIYRSLLKEYGKDDMPPGWKEPRGVHEWELKSFTKPTYCAVCHGLLVGLYRQGYSCKRCKINVHGKVTFHDDSIFALLMFSCSASSLLSTVKTGTRG